MTVSSLITNSCSSRRTKQTDSPPTMHARGTSYSRSEVLLVKLGLFLRSPGSGDTLFAVLHGAVGGDATVCIDEPDNYVALRELQPWLTLLRDRVEDEGGQC